ncbi:MAG TPA: triose-phosphate isomerase [Candidatus Paceibacterota bacterium]
MAGKSIVVANWKMHPKTLAEAKHLFLGVKKAVSRVRGVVVVVCSPAVFLAELRKLYVGKRISFGGQDVHAEKSGAYTGSTSASMLKSVGASYVIIGHSERRIAGETNEDVQEKVRAALNEHLTVVLCIGEQRRDYEGEYLTFVKDELEVALSGVAADELRRVVIAYEPIWAIGKTANEAMKPHDMHQMTLFIRKILAEQYNREVALKVAVLYGGSVEPENCEALIKDGDVNGFLVGHASLDPTSFGAILACVHEKR